MFRLFPFFQIVPLDQDLDLAHSLISIFPVQEINQGSVYSHILEASAYFKNPMILFAIR